MGWPVGDIILQGGQRAPGNSAYHLPSLVMPAPTSHLRPATRLTRGWRLISNGRLAMFLRNQLLRYCEASLGERRHLVREIAYEIMVRFPSTVQHLDLSAEDIAEVRIATWTAPAPLLIARPTVREQMDAGPRPTGHDDRRNVGGSDGTDDCVEVGERIGGSAPCLHMYCSEQSMRSA